MIFIIHDYFNGTISKIIHFIYSDFRLTPVVILFFITLSVIQYQLANYIFYFVQTMF